MRTITAKRRKPVWYGRRKGKLIKYHKRRNRWKKRVKDRISKRLLKKYKHKDYKFLKKRFDIKPYGDLDRDKVVNVRDCKPLDRKRQDDIYTPEVRRHLQNINILEHQHAEILQEVYQAKREGDEAEVERLYEDMKRLASAINEEEDLLEELEDFP